MANYMLKDINNDLWHKLKIYCAVKRTTIKDLIIKLITAEIDRFEKEGG